MDGMLRKARVTWRNKTGLTLRERGQKRGCLWRAAAPTPARFCRLREPLEIRASMSKTQMFELAEVELDYRDLQTVTVFAVRPVTRSMVAGFIEKWHYSHNVNGITDEYSFGLYHENTLIGGALFGTPATPGVAEAYSEGGTLRVTELRRLCCIDNTP